MAVLSYQYIKPMSKSSSIAEAFKESLGGWNQGIATGVNGLVRAS